MSVVERLSSRLEGDWAGFLSSCLVGSVIPPGDNNLLRSWLVCESPHVDEVCAGCPLVGRAGKTVTRALFKADVLGQNCVRCGRSRPIDNLRDREDYCECPVGALIQTGAIDWMGIINASELPLQSRAYEQKLIAYEQRLINVDGAPPDVLRSQGWATLMRTIKHVKGFSQRTPMPHENTIEHDLLEDFENRVTRVRHEVGSGHRILLCGEVAKAFWRLMDSTVTEVNTRPVSHPAARNERWFNRNEECSVTDALRWLAYGD